jgi:hypothetical protein
MRSSLLCLPFVVFALTYAGLAERSLAKDSSAIRTTLQNTGVDADAQATLVAVLRSPQAVLVVKLTGLTPAADYSFLVGSIPEASFRADSDGRARLRFATKGGGDRQPLDFDVRGKTVSVTDGSGATVLQAVISGRGEVEGARVSERAALTLQAGAVGRARARYELREDGRAEFRVDLNGVTGSGFTIFVNGINRGAITLRGKNGTARFESDAEPGDDEQALTFDPRGAIIEILQGDVVRFRGRLEAKVRGVNVAKPSTRSSLISSTGVDADGTLRARLRIDDRARKHFSVELEDVPVGSYEFLVNGVLKGTIVVRTTAAGTEGELEFSNDDDDSDELLLDFDPVGATLIVRQGSVIFFSGTFQPGGGQTGGAGAGKPSQLEERLTSTGLDPDASGEAEYETKDDGDRDFEVEIEDGPAGSYQLFVGGTLRGTFQAQLSGGEVKGEIEFSSGSDDDDELPLNFEPRGALIKVKGAGGVYFSHRFGSGSSAGGGGAAPMEIEVPLFSSTTLANATAKAEYKRDEDGDLSFEVEIEDAPISNYELLVEGAVRGTISVVAVNGGTRGELEFESEDEDGALPLNFEVLGKVITIRRDGTVHFERQFPSGQ